MLINQVFFQINMYTILSCMKFLCSMWIRKKNFFDVFTCTDKLIANSALRRRIQLVMNHFDVKIALHCWDDFIVLATATLSNSDTLLLKVANLFLATLFVIFLSFFLKEIHCRRSCDHFLIFFNRIITD